MHVVRVLNALEALAFLFQVKLRLRPGIEARHEFVEFRGSGYYDDILVARF